MRIEKLEDGKVKFTITMPTKHYSFILEKEDIQQLRDIILGESTVMVHPMTFEDTAVPPISDSKPTLDPCKCHKGGAIRTYMMKYDDERGIFTVLKCLNCGHSVRLEGLRSDAIMIEAWNKSVSVPEEPSLLPCPFCGGTADVSENASSFSVFCCDCYASIKDVCCDDLDKSEVIQKWNTRVK